MHALRPLESKSSTMSIIFEQTKSSSPKKIKKSDLMCSTPDQNSALKKNFLESYRSISDLNFLKFSEKIEG